MYFRQHYDDIHFSGDDYIWRLCIEDVVCQVKLDFVKMYAFVLYIVVSVLCLFGKSVT